MASLRVLHVAAECYPLAKTGGLGDVVAALPAAQRAIGIDACVALPGYRGLRDCLREPKALTRFAAGGEQFTVIAGRVHDEQNSLPVLLFECPPLYDRGGDPYRDAHGVEFTDNARRFARFCEAVAIYACGHAPFDLLHLHDWQAALAAGWLGQQGQRPRVLYSIHNLAYQGHVAADRVQQLQLPPPTLAAGTETWGGFSCMKAGIRLADAVATVSPGYAREILTPAYGYGMEAALRECAGGVHGILNGIDTQLWNPRSDHQLERNYSEHTLAEGKRANKLALQRELGLAESDAPLLAYIGRLAEQKGADLILQAREALLALPLQLVVLATGDLPLQQAFREFADAAPAGQVAVRLLHDERLAHRINAAADLLLMPSRYEPCGLNQMYAQRYGTLPLVRRTGGLADSVVDATDASIADGSATGVQFLDADAGGVLYAVRRGLQLHADEALRTRLQRAGMARDFSWSLAAQQYQQLYRQLCPAPVAPADSTAATGIFPTGNDVAAAQHPLPA
ncbi:MAG TPA: glycogen synthase GlgA [Nevskiaceae bacterium]|nr:glycogen synthase GlgA [Nevskiaceae bacterium]